MLHEPGSRFHDRYGCAREKRNQLQDSNDETDIPSDLPHGTVQPQCPRLGFGRKFRDPRRNVILEIRSAVHAASAIKSFAPSRRSVATEKIASLGSSPKLAEKLGFDTQEVRLVFAVFHEVTRAFYMKICICIPNSLQVVKVQQSCWTAHEKAMS